jgi:hypothetical protein
MAPREVLMSVYSLAAAHRIAVLVAIGLLMGLLGPGPAFAEGPWKAQVVDAETGEPLEGVVVLMYWVTYTSSWAGWAGGDFHDAEEVVTGPDGRFVVPRRLVFTLIPWKKVSREMVIFKPGYGQWRFREARQWDKLPRWESKAKFEEAWKRFEGEGVVLELSPLKTREERLKFYDGPYGHAPTLVPPERTRRLDEARDTEARYLGLGAR